MGRAVLFCRLPRLSLLPPRHHATTMRPLLSTRCLLALTDLEEVLTLIPADDEIGLADMRLHLAAWRASYNRHWRSRR